jgi:hypothetical protein
VCPRQARTLRWRGLSSQTRVIVVAFGADPFRAGVDTLDREAGVGDLLGVLQPAGEIEGAQAQAAAKVRMRVRVGLIPHRWVKEGFVVAAGDISSARPPRAVAPAGTGTVVSIHVAAGAGRPARTLTAARLVAGQGIEGDRHVIGTGTFPSGLPGSALTLIEQSVCEELALTPDEHRRNLVVDGLLELNDLVGHEFMIGQVRCRGMRLCEPCTVIQRYARRQIIRPLVHRGGLRADILTDGEIRVGDRVGAPSYGNLSTLLALRSVVRGFSRDR